MQEKNTVWNDFMQKKLREGEIASVLAVSDYFINFR